MNIFFDDSESGDIYRKRYEEKMREALSVVAAKEGLPFDDVEVSVSFVSPEEIHKLNKEYRDTDRETDVLSFPQFDSREELLEMHEMTGVAELGDVVISMERAKEQASEYGHGLEREVIYLFVHSILHLLGYDHMEEGEKKIMRNLEEEVMGEISLTR